MGTTHAHHACAPASCSMPIVRVGLCCASPNHAFNSSAYGVINKGKFKESDHLHVEGAVCLNSAPDRSRKKCGEKGNNFKIAVTTFLAERSFEFQLFSSSRIWVLIRFHFVFWGAERGGGERGGPSATTLGPSSLQVNGNHRRRDGGEL